jgi:hypothetical protein
MTAWPLSHVLALVLFLVLSIDLFSQPFELLLERRTYGIFAAYWLRVPVDSASHAIADLFNSVPKHVATARGRASIRYA